MFNDIVAACGMLQGLWFIDGMVEVLRRQIVVAVALLQPLMVLARQSERPSGTGNGGPQRAMYMVRIYWSGVNFSGGPAGGHHGWDSCPPIEVGPHYKVMVWFRVSLQGRVCSGAFNDSAGRSSLCRGCPWCGTTWPRFRASPLVQLRIIVYPRLMSSCLLEPQTGGVLFCFSFKTPNKRRTFNKTCTPKGLVDGVYFSLLQGSRKNWAQTLLL